MTTRYSAFSGFCLLLLNACFFTVLSSSQLAHGQDKETGVTGSGVKITKVDDRLVVKIDGKPFTEFRYKGLRKPILFPVYGPNQIPMTRSYPMVKGIPNESTDHPHHQSIWFTHGKVNKADFWISSELRKGTKAKIETTETKIAGDKIISKSNWINSKGDIVCNDVRTMHFGQTKDGNRFIDFQVEISSDQHNVIFGETKEGTMAIRIHPMLRLTPDKKRGTTEVNGQAINSEGVKGRKIWGKRAKWVAYWGKIDQKEVGIAIFDHNTNLRHPTWWHARHYGLVGANPFGIHDFDRKAKKGSGDYVLKKKDTLKLQYRFLFFSGNASQDRMEKEFQNYIAN